MNPGTLSPQAMVRSNLCIGCGSCAAQSGLAGVRMEMDGAGQYRPAGPAAWLRGHSADLSRTCPFSPLAANEDEIAADLFPDAGQRHTSSGRFLAAYAGHVAENGFRDRGSSGGMVSWVAAELLRRGRIDGLAHVAKAADPRAGGRFFHYRISRSEEEIRAGAKSRYYPVELAEVLREIRSVPGRYAVVGIPCFVKAVHLLRRNNPLFRERIVHTLGLFCGHMKSARLVESFAWQMGVAVADIREVEFRLKDATRPASVYTAQLTLRDGRTVRKDWFHMVDGDWGAGFFQNTACNFCDDVVAETADASFGDAWVEPYSSDGRGTNVVIVRSPAIRELVDAGIRDGRLRLRPVDGAFVEQTQAAGLRQRREGLAYRLSWSRAGIRPRKRVQPMSRIPLRRKLIYRMRALITAWSHRLFRTARLLHWPALYLGWARAVYPVYTGLTYGRGALGVLFNRIGLGSPRR